MEQGSVVDGAAEAIIDYEDTNNEDNSENEEEYKSNSENEDSTATNDAILQAPRITTRGAMPRTMRPARHADGTEIRNYGLAVLVDNEEMIEEAISIEDRLLGDTYDLGEGEFSLITGNLLRCPSDIEEAYFHAEIDPNNNYENIEHAFGYTNEQNEMMLVAAYMKKDDDAMQAVAKMSWTASCLFCLPKASPGIIIY
jgi:hypothetical protein